MEGLRFKFVALCALAIMTVLPANGQAITSCTNSMVNSFTPCLSFITSGNGTSPTADCCNSLKSLTNASTDCACNILTGNVPFQIPINRTLAVSLPQACNSSALPLQCKAGVSPPAPVTAPAPSAIMPPSATPTASPVPEAVTPTSEPSTPSTVPPTSEPSTPSTVPPTSSTPSGTGTTSPDIRPTVTPNSAAATSAVTLQAVLFAAVGILVLSYY